MHYNATAGWEMARPAGMYAPCGQGARPHERLACMPLLALAAPAAPAHEAMASHKRACCAASIHLRPYIGAAWGRRDPSQNYPALGMGEGGAQRASQEGHGVMQMCKYRQCGPICDVSIYAMASLAQQHLRWCAPGAYGRQGLCCMAMGSCSAACRQRDTSRQPLHGNVHYVLLFSSRARSSGAGERSAWAPNPAAADAATRRRPPGMGVHGKAAASQGGSSTATNTSAHPT